MEQPTYLTFDCYGTLVDFDLSAATLQALGTRADGIDVTAFLKDFETFRYEAVLGEYVPYREVLRRSLAEAMELYGMEYRAEDGEAIIAAVPTFGPFPDVPLAREKLGERFRLVIISNTEDDLIAITAYLASLKP
jgi:2-haloacid dehalogenase